MTGVVLKTDLHLTENVIKMLIVITLQVLLGRGIENCISCEISIKTNFDEGSVTDSNLL